MITAMGTAGNRRCTNAMKMPQDFIDDKEEAGAVGIRAASFRLGVSR